MDAPFVGHFLDLEVDLQPSVPVIYGPLDILFSKFSFVFQHMVHSDPTHTRNICYRVQYPRRNRVVRTKWLDESLLILHLVHTHTHPKEALLPLLL
jgi:hypothetical protein